MPTPRSRLLLLSGARSPFARDTFTDANGTALTGHTPERGTWTRSSASTGAGDPVIASNRLRNQNDASFRIHSLVAPTSPNYRVACDVVMRSDNNASIAGVIARMVTNTLTYYWPRYTTVANAWQLFKVVAGVATQLGSDAAATLTVDQAYRLELAVIGSRLTVTVDGVILIEVTDTAIAAAGAAGVLVHGAATDATGVHLDSILVRSA